MPRHGLSALVILLTCLEPAIGMADAPADGRFPQSGSAIEHLARFAREHPAAAISARAGRITRVYGAGISGGASPPDSAERFRTRHAPMFGVAPDELVPDGPADGTFLMPDPATGAPRFTVFRYAQRKGSLPVHGTRLAVLVRNDGGHPVVLASANLRDLQGLEVEGAGRPRPSARQLQALADRHAGPGAEVVSSEPVIWAGREDEPAAARLADRTVVRHDADRWLLVTDAATGALLHREPMICFAGLEGRVTAFSTQGVFSEQCAEERLTAVPYARIVTDRTTVYADSRGRFLLEDPRRPPLPVSVDLRGQWFHVNDFSGAEDLGTTVVHDGGRSLELVLNPANTELHRARVNAFIAANAARDYVLRYLPDYPGLNTPLQIWVNRDDTHCPGNAWYDYLEGSLNFCRAGEEHPNTAWTSVVYHEYGHHLVHNSPSGQGPYGEGIGDAVSLLLLDDPRLAAGYWGNCVEPLRNADNDCQFHPVGCSTCGASIHTCAQLLSGCIWSLRNELAAVEPETFRDTLSRLVLSSIQVHTGAAITADIAVDFLTLDDDDGNIFDGTPHYHQIADAFNAHGLDAPFVPLIAFEFPEGRPELIPPGEEVSFLVEVRELTGAALPKSGKLHFSATGRAGSFMTVPMTEVQPNFYEATLPPLDCWSSVFYYVSAEASLGLVTPLHTFPVDAPRSSLVSFTTQRELGGFTDDFEEDHGWIVEDSDTLLSGRWERGAPMGPGTRGDPRQDGDGSGQCFLTDNDPDNPDSDVDQGFTTLISPAMDATQDEDGVAFISYYRWYSNTEGGGPYQDPLVVEISDDDGATWTLLETVGPAGPEVDGGWLFRRFRVDDFVEPNDQVRIRFTASDTDPQSVVEAAIDAVGVRRYVCDDAGQPCLADLTGDAVVDVDDLVAILAAWGAAEGPADLDGDGLVDASDLLMVLIEWGPCG